MSLEACPICGYALSTDNGQCRHCPPVGRLTGNFGWINLLAYGAAMASVIYFLYHH